MISSRISSEHPEVVGNPGELFTNEGWELPVHELKPAESDIPIGD
jgi:hypothetical protein